MMEIARSATFDRWMTGLRDARAKARIAARIDRLAHGNPGDVKPIRSGIREMRIDHGPCYRVYVVQRGAMLVILLCGGDKSTQAADIAMARKIACVEPVMIRESFGHYDSADYLK